MATTTTSIIDQAVRIATRAANPEGSFDTGGRWYPATECACCRSIRQPSRAWPYSYLTHCRSIAHLANEYGVDARELRRAIKVAQSN